MVAVSSFSGVRAVREREIWKHGEIGYRIVAWAVEWEGRPGKKPDLGSGG